MALYVFKDDDKGWAVECDVEATVVPRVRARVNCRNDDASPAEGGYLEDVEFNVLGMTVSVMGVPCGVNLSESAREGLGRYIKGLYDCDPSMQDDLWEMFEDLV